MLHFFPSLDLDLEQKIPDPEKLKESTGSGFTTLQLRGTNLHSSAQFRVATPKLPGAMIVLGWS